MSNICQRYIRRHCEERNGGSYMKLLNTLSTDLEEMLTELCDDKNLARSDSEVYSRSRSPSPVSDLEDKTKRVTNNQKTADTSRARSKLTKKDKRTSSPSPSLLKTTSKKTISAKIRSDSDSSRSRSPSPVSDLVKKTKGISNKRKTANTSRAQSKPTKKERRTSSPSPSLLKTKPKKPINPKISDLTEPETKDIFKIISEEENISYGSGAGRY